MRYTILGASGFIGSNLVRALRSVGADVAAPERGDEAWLDADAGHVIDAAGVTSDFAERPFDTVDAHVTRVARVLERARFASFLYLSSTRPYARVERAVETSALPVDPADPDQLYDATKVAGEALCLALDRPAVRVARLSNVYGDRFDGPGFLDTVVRAARTHGSVVLRSGPGSAKDYVWIGDVASLLPRIAAGGRHRVYNVAAGTNVTHDAIARLLERHAGTVVTVAPGATDRVWPPISIDRARAELGFAPVALSERLPALLAAEPAREART